MNRCRLPIVAGMLTILFTGGTMVMAAEGTRLANLKQPPLNTTMMGALKGASDYHGLKLSGPMIYGLSGHAFLINIHVELCPSGPYVWKRKNAKPLIANMGMKMTDLGFFGTDAAPEARAKIERQLREALDKRIPCSLINLENQLIDGYDDAGLFTAQPWAPKMSFPPDRLSFLYSCRTKATHSSMRMMQPFVFLKIRPSNSDPGLTPLLSASATMA